MFEINSKLRDAVKSQDVNQITHWLDQGAEIDFKDPKSDNKTPLFTAVSDGSKSVVSLLIDRRADVNFSSLKDKKPIFAASKNLSPEVIQTLLLSGAKIELDCLEVVKAQLTVSDNKLRTLTLLKIASFLDAARLMYFLPILYEHTKSEKILAIKYELLMAYLNLDSKLVDKHLASAYQLDPAFHLNASKLLKQIVRRYDLTAKQLTGICADMRKTVLQEDVALLQTLAQIVKYSVKRRNVLSILQIMDIIEFVNHASVRHELIWAIQYIVNCEGPPSISKKHQKKLEVLLSQMNHPAKSFFDKFLNVPVVMHSHAMHPSKYLEQKHDRPKIGNHNKPSTSVSKQLQTSKITH